MSTSPWPPTAGIAPDPAPAVPAEGAAADGATAPAAASAAPTSEHHPVKEGGYAVATAAVPPPPQQQQEEEAKPQLLREDDLKADQEHEHKINKYQAILAARLKDKYFSNKAFDGGDVFEAETIVDGEIIQSSMWPCTSSFANPINIFQEKSNNKSDSPSLTADSSAKNNSPRTDSSPKNSASALATENNLTPGKRQPSKKT
ncbi:hypothetical protein GUJ93_ZPchr0009g821 [Zizania palustris]|uniref:Uncharacterized protein n=1 Tax=Zizania palustris TaxID=103762 RepID=A0A8J5S2U4_ZIZPA|nr:hypothetical protein GUJ93_ZPchr0009g821 [Zizania palustris]